MKDVTKSPHLFDKGKFIIFYMGVEMGTLMFENRRWHVETLSGKSTNCSSEELAIQSLINLYYHKPAGKKINKSKVQKSLLF